MGIKLVEGRLLTDSDVETSPRAVVVSAAYREKYARGETLIGRRVQVNDDWYTVVGIVADVRQSGLDEEAAPHVYASFRQINGGRTGLLVRTRNDPAAIVGSLREQIKKIDPEMPIYDINTMSDLLARAAAPRRLNLALIAGFAVLALLLASVGIYGVMANMVTQRTGEIGVRLAFGASSRDVFELVAGHGLRLTLLGVSIGIASSFALMRLVSSLLFDVSATDPAIFLSVAMAVATMAMVACLVPARRAMRVDPISALRDQ